MAPQIDRQPQGDPEMFGTLTIGDMSPEEKTDGKPGLESELSLSPVGEDPFKSDEHLAW